MTPFTSIIYRYVLHLMFRPSLVFLFHCILFVLAYSEDLWPAINNRSYFTLLRIYRDFTLQLIVAVFFSFSLVCLSLCCLFPIKIVAHNAHYITRTTYHVPRTTDMIRLIRLFARGQYLLAFSSMLCILHRPSIVRICTE